MKFDDSQRVFFCKNCIQNCLSRVETAPKNILIVADVKAPNNRVSPGNFNFRFDLQNFSGFLVPCADSCEQYPREWKAV